MAAYFACVMLANDARYRPDFHHIEALDWQVRASGWHFDDLLITFQQPKPGRIALTLKSNRAVCTRGFDQQIVTRLWQQWLVDREAGNPFSPVTDLLGVVTSRLDPSLYHAWHRLSHATRNTAPQRVAADYATGSNKLGRRLFDSLRCPQELADGRHIDDVEVTELISRLRLFHLDFLCRPPIALNDAHSMCLAVCHDADRDKASLLWQLIVSNCARHRAGGTLSWAALCDALPAELVSRVRLHDVRAGTVAAGQSVSKYIESVQLELGSFSILSQPSRALSGHVPVELMPLTNEEPSPVAPSSPSQPVDGDSPRGASAELSTLSIDRALKQHRRVWISGPSGAGKSVLLQHAACVLSAAWRELDPTAHESTRLPIHLQLAQFSDDLVELCLRCVHARGLVCSRDVLERWLQSGYCVLLIDGLDDCQAKRKQILAAIKDLAAAWPELRFVIVSQESDGGLPGIVRLGVRPLADTAVQQVLTEHLGRPKGRQAFLLLRDAQQLTPFRAPMYAWFLAMAMEHDELDRGALRVGEIYRRVLSGAVRRYLELADHPPCRPTEAMLWLGSIAQKMVESNSSTLTELEILGIVKADGGTGQTASQFIGAMKRIGLLTGEGTSVAFQHTSYRAHLCAAAGQRMRPSRFLATIKLDASFAEIVQHFIDISDEITSEVILGQLFQWVSRRMWLSYFDISESTVKRLMLLVRLLAYSKYPLLKLKSRTIWLVRKRRLWLHHVPLVVRQNHRYTLEQVRFYTEFASHVARFRVSLSESYIANWMSDKERHPPIHRAVVHLQRPASECVDSILEDIRAGQLERPRGSFAAAARVLLSLPPEVAIPKIRAFVRDADEQHARTIVFVLGALHHWEQESSTAEYPFESESEALPWIDLLCDLAIHDQRDSVRHTSGKALPGLGASGTFAIPQRATERFAAVLADGDEELSIRVIEHIVYSAHREEFDILPKLKRLLERGSWILCLHALRAIRIFELENFIESMAFVLTRWQGAEVASIATDWATQLSQASDPRVSSRATDLAVVMVNGVCHEAVLIRDWCALALGQCESPVITHWLLDRIYENRAESGQVRQTALCWACDKIKDWTILEPLLLGAFADSTPEVRERAARIVDRAPVAEIGRFEMPLLTLAVAEDGYATRHARWALDRMDGRHPGFRQQHEYEQLLDAKRMK